MLSFFRAGGGGYVDSSSSSDGGEYDDEPYDWTTKPHGGEALALAKADRKRLETMDSELRCTICRNPFDTPMRFAECGHAFCSRCILKHLDQKKSAASGDHSRCPSQGCNKPYSKLIKCDVLATVSDLFFACRPALLALVRRGDGAAAMKDGGSSESDGAEDVGAPRGTATGPEGQRMQLMSKVNYHTTNEKRLKQMLAKLSPTLSLAGRKEALVKRHKRFALENNVQYHRNEWASADEIAQRVAVAEAPTKARRGRRGSSSGGSKALRAALGSHSADPAAQRRAIEARAVAAGSAGGGGGSAAVHAARTPLAAPWRSVWSSRVKRVFYYNPDLDTGQWTRPASAAAPPAAPSARGSASPPAPRAPSGARKRPRGAPVASASERRPESTAAKRQRTRASQSDAAESDFEEEATSSGNQRATRAQGAALAKSSAVAKGRPASNSKSKSRSRSKPKTKSKSASATASVPSPEARAPIDLTQADESEADDEKEQQDVVAPRASSASAAVISSSPSAASSRAAGAATPPPALSNATTSSSVSSSAPVAGAWACGTCTFLNEAAMLEKCSMCNSARPRDLHSVLRSGSTMRGATSSGGRKAKGKSRTPRRGGARC